MNVTPPFKASKMFILVLLLSSSSLFHWLMIRSATSSLWIDPIAATNLWRMHSLSVDPQCPSSKNDTEVLIDVDGDMKGRSEMRTMSLIVIQSSFPILLNFLFRVWKWENFRFCRTGINTYERLPDTVDKVVFVNGKWRLRLCYGRLNASYCQNWMCEKSTFGSPGFLDLRQFFESWDLFNFQNFQKW